MDKWSNVVLFLLQFFHPNNTNTCVENSTDLQERLLASSPALLDQLGFGQVGKTGYDGRPSRTLGSRPGVDWSLAAQSFLVQFKIDFSLHADKHGHLLCLICQLALNTWKGCLTTNQNNSFYFPSLSKAIAPLVTLGFFHTEWEALAGDNNLINPSWLV